ncbi:hypothetical protein C6341_g17801 [Phytophthora cactorum]|nr:hypothetical protein C6341_g17801 [Phytophthora cactorum]
MRMIPSQRATGPDETNAHADDPEPKSYRHARRCSECSLGAAAEQEEIDALKSNETWTLVKWDGRAVRLHTKWVYKKKRTGTGLIERSFSFSRECQALVDLVEGINLGIEGSCMSVLSRS